MSAWEKLDKDVKALRKQEWIKIQENLELTGLTKTYIKVLKAYFLRGKENDDILLLFKLWLHIDDSLENWKLLRKETSRGDFIQSCEQFNLYVIAPSVRNDTMKSYGFMGGKEKRVMEFLFNGSDDQGLYHFDKTESLGQSITVNKSLVFLDFRGLSYKLNAWIWTGCPNLYSPVQYMVEDWYESIFKVKSVAQFSDGKGSRIVPNDLLLLVYIRAKKDISLVEKFDMAEFYLEIPETLTESQQKTADELFHILETREFPAVLQGHWESVKKIAEN